MQPLNIRSHNLSRVLRHIAHAEGPLSRADIAAHTGLAKPTVSNLVDQLVTGGLVAEGAPERLGGTGRPMTPLRASRDGAIGIGIEVSADHVAVMLRQLDGSTSASSHTRGDFTNAPEAAAASAAELLIPLIHALRPATRIAGITAAIPGRISHDRRTVTSAPNLGWTDVPFSQLLHNQLTAHLNAENTTAPHASGSRGPAGHTRHQSLPIPLCGNDARLVARTEMTRRPGESFVVVHGETGIGGTLVINGDILHGSQGWAGEIGHVVVDPNGPPCRCGRSGCLESYASAWVLRKRANISDDAAIDEIPELINPEVLDDLAYWLGIGLASTLTLLDVPTVVLSGYFGRLFPQIHERVAATVAEHSLAAEARQITIAQAAEIDNAPLIGSSIYSLKPLFDDPLPWLES